MNFGDAIIGHGTILRLLEAWVNKPANGYIFVGPAQVGKRRVAERFMAGLLDIGSTKVRIRDENTNVRIHAHPDFILLDVPEGKKEIPVELVRNARAQLAGRPMVAPRRLLFIPRADRLNEEGVNVLLKVVEEPPAGAVCVAIVEDLLRLPATLQSRMVKVPFHPVPRQQVEAGLMAHGMSAEEAAQKAGECRGRPGRLKIEDRRLKVEDGSGNSDLQHSNFNLPSSGSLGEWLEIIDRAAKECEAAEDPQAAWSALLDDWAASLLHPLSSTFTFPPSSLLVLGQGILTARRFVGGALSPRLPLEAAVTRLDNLNIFPTHIGTPIPRVFLR